MATVRAQAKAERQLALRREASRLFAARGFDGVSLEDLGSAVGISGPAVYRHFSTKQALLAAILIGASEHLLAGGSAVSGASPDERLDALIAFHVDFALRDADVIRVQGRDLDSLADDERHLVRRLQREYVELWVDVLSELHPDLARGQLRVRAHAAFGLINSTPHSVRALKSAPTDASVRRILTTMAGAALRA